MYQGHGDYEHPGPVQGMVYGISFCLALQMRQIPVEYPSIMTDGAGWTFRTEYSGEKLTIRKFFSKHFLQKIIFKIARKKEIRKNKGIFGILKMA